MNSPDTADAVNLFCGAPVSRKAPEDETRRLIASVDDYTRHAQRDRAMLYTLAHGLRVSEVCDLNVGDVIPPKDGGLPALKVRGQGSKA